MATRTTQPTLRPAGRRTLLDRLGVEQAEARSVGLMTAHSFFMGCATVFFETAASASFLARYPGSALPWVYLAAAAVNTVTGATYARLTRRASFARLMSGTLWFLLAVALAVRVGFAAVHTAWIAFAALVAYRVVSSLTDLEYWAVASRIYDVRQAKRLFGLIGTGEVVARTAGAFSVPLLVRAGGDVRDLILLSSAALALCLVALRAVLRDAGAGAASDGPRATDPPADGAACGGLRALRASPYLLLVVGVAVLATFGKYFVDFAYLAQLGALGRSEAQLAGFLGLFSGLVQSLSLLTRLFVSRPLLARFGVRGGVLVLPLAHAVCAAVTIGCGLAGAGAAALFACVLANQGIYKTLKHPIDNASFKVLYQPLSAQERLSTQVAVEVIFAPLVVGAAGGLMLLFSAAGRFDVVRFSALMLATFVAWTLAARAAGRAYGRQLRERLRAPLEAAEPRVVVVGDGAGVTVPELDATLAALATCDVGTRAHLLARLDQPGYAALRGPQRDAALELLCAEAREAAWTAGALRDLARAPVRLEPVRDALREELARARERGFALLALAHDRATVHSAARHLGPDAGAETRALAREALDLALPARLRPIVLPLLLDASAEERLARWRRQFPQRARGVDACLAELAARPPRWTSELTRRLARAALASLRCAPSRPSHAPARVTLSPARPVARAG